MDDQESVVQPLGLSALNNVATVRPLNSSKIPTPGSRLPTAHRFGAPTTKRKAEDDLAAEDEKKAKLNLSITSTSSESSITSMTSNSSARSAGSNMSKKGGTKPNVARRGPTTSAAAARKPVTGSRPQVKGVVRNPPSVAAPKRGAAASTVTRGVAAKPAAPKTAAAAPTSRRPPAAPKTEKPAAAGAKKPKRAQWDYKGKLDDMHEYMSSIKAEMGDNTDRIQQLEHRNRQLIGDVEIKHKETTQASEEIEDLRRKIRHSEDELADSTRRLSRTTSELEDSRRETEGQKRENAGLSRDNAALGEEVSGLKSAVSSLTSAQFAVKAELEGTKTNLEQALEAGRLKDSEIAELKARIASLEGTVREQEADAREHEMTRRKMHNSIQELKGNIRVFCRVRPMLGEETNGNNGQIEHIHFPADDKVLELVKAPDGAMNETCAGGARRSDSHYEFSFDRVFGPASRQSGVFEEISQLVQSALDGYNVCIFAYGQTGSGKTYTMEGPVVKSEDDEGMIPRSVAQIFTSARDLEQQGWKYEFEVSFLEIYNESVRDLLGNGKDESKHEIKMVSGSNNKNEVDVTHLTLVKVSEETEVHKLLKRASENRAVGVTKCNERSSRSHSVFRLKLTGHNVHSDQKSNGVLNLIDLAGSERLKESGSEGQRLKETQKINTSLANLGNVIMALANKDKHIPYRNSKLTYLLQNSLGGNSKTLMFVNVSPKEDCFNETLNSLRFATKVNNCNIGTAQKCSTK